MDTTIRYRGKDYGEEEISFVRELIAANPGASRRALSLKLCEAWQWYQANGAPRDMVCRGLLLTLHRAGHIELPKPRYHRPVPAPRRVKSMEIPESERRPIESPLKGILPLEILQVRRTHDESLFEALIEQHHYLGYTKPVGEHLKYLIRAQEAPVACMMWTSAPRHIGCRDRYIGWTPQERKKNIHLIAYNQRFLILPWVRVKYLATHLLGRMARRISGDWERLYGHPVYFLETFVDTERFRGTTYRAANWVEMGQSTGRGKDDVQHRGPNRSIKNVFGYPLRRDFRKKLCGR